MSYAPQPIDTAHVTLPTEIYQLTERLAENAHDHWARQRLAEGWSYGPMRDDIKKEHPWLVPYAALPDAEKQYDRLTAEVCTYHETHSQGRVCRTVSQMVQDSL